MERTSAPDMLTHLEREMIVKALECFLVHERELPEDELRMARRLMATLKPPPSIPDR